MPFLPLAATIKRTKNSFELRHIQADAFRDGHMSTPRRTTPEEVNAAVAQALRQLPAKTADVLDRLRLDLEDSERDLAECYRLSGADPDGNEDWRLAPYAVQEVRRMCQERDELAAENDLLRRERDEADADAKRAWVWADRGVPDCRCVLAFGMKDGKVAHRDCEVPQYERDLAAHEAREALKRARGDK